VDTVSRVSQVKEAFIDYGVVETSAIRVIVYHNGASLGSISFNHETDFTVCRELEFSQWVTLFDEVDDDLYDGDLGEDDEENPKVLITFKLVDGPTPTVSAPLLSQNVSHDHQEDQLKSQSFYMDKSKTVSVNNSQVL
jgi:hypothetical protein